MKGGIWIANAFARSPKVVTAAQLPGASAVPVGTVFRVSDWNNIRVRSDGAFWIPDGRQILYKNQNLITAPGDLNKNILDQFTIPANLGGAALNISIWTSWNATVNADVKTITIEMDTNVYFSSGLANNGGGRFLTEYFQNGSQISCTTATAIGNSTFSGSVNTPATFATNGAIDRVVTITSTKAVAIDVVQLTHTIVEVC